jgi:hypothetical protein
MKPRRGVRGLARYVAKVVEFVAGATCVSGK